MESIEDLINNAISWMNDNFTTGVLVAASVGLMYSGYQSHEAKKREAGVYESRPVIIRNESEESSAKRVYSTKFIYSKLTGAQNSE